MSIAARADISPEARAQIELLEDAGIVVPTRDNIKTYRRDLLENSAAFVAERVAAFAGDIAQIEIAGIGCRQVTPSGWNPAGGPVILYAFGGGYVSGSTAEDQVIALPLARLTAARVIMVDYCLSPEHPYPRPQQDMRRVYPPLLDIYGAAPAS